MLVILIFLIIMLVIFAFACVIRLRRLSTYQGRLVVTRNDNGHRLFMLEVDADPDDMEKMKRVSFKVTDKKRPEYEEETERLAD